MPSWPAFLVPEGDEHKFQLCMITKKGEFQENVLKLE
jgi:hypothetical protein